jgi:hypothetical protein
MANDQDPSVKPVCSLAELGYAIRSARAVVEALIARDRNAAEEAALRTCHECDLLVRLIRDLAHLLRDSLNQQFGLDPVAVVALVRRANHVLALVEATPSPNPISVTPARALDDETVQVLGQCEDFSGRQSHGDGSVAAPHASQGQMVASLGLRVRLIPFEADDNTSPAPEERKDDASQPASAEGPPRGVER